MFWPEGFVDVHISMMIKRGAERRDLESTLCVFGVLQGVVNLARYLFSTRGTWRKLNSQTSVDSASAFDERKFVNNDLIPEDFTSNEKRPSGSYLCCA